MLKSPPGLFARPLLGDVLKGLGVAVVFAAVVILPQVLLPWHIVRWGIVTLTALMLWFIGFMVVRSARDQRRWTAETAQLQADWAATQARWAAEDAARAAPADPRDPLAGRDGADVSKLPARAQHLAGPAPQADGV